MRLLLLKFIKSLSFRNSLHLQPLVNNITGIMFAFFPAESPSENQLQPSPGVVAAWVCGCMGLCPMFSRPRSWMSCFKSLVTAPFLQPSDYN